MIVQEGRSRHRHTHRHMDMYVAGALAYANFAFLPKNRRRILYDSVTTRERSPIAEPLSLAFPPEIKATFSPLCNEKIRQLPLAECCTSGQSLTRDSHRSKQ